MKKSPQETLSYKRERGERKRGLLDPSQILGLETFEKERKSHWTLSLRETIESYSSSEERKLMNNSHRDLFTH